MTSPALSSDRAPRPHWVDALIVMAVVLVGYAIAPTRIPLHGEETCRALHGIEMAETGDWLVATNQHVPILDRPPLHYWILALVHRGVHALDPLTLRWTMIVATLATAWLVWWYARRLLSANAALVAGVAYPTIGHVFDLGLRAETDGIYALFLGAAWLVWHALDTAGDRPWRAWILGCALGACATLTKGLQGAVSFYGALGLDLLLRRELHRLWRPPALVGFAVFVGLIAIWNVPFWFVTGWEGSRETWIDPLTMRVDDEIDTSTAIARLARFPLTVFGAALPWSALLMTLAFRPLQAATPIVRSAGRFALVGMFVVFVPVWISEGGLRRHVMGMYPMLAVFAGVVAERVAAGDAHRGVRRIWTVVLRLLAVAIGGVFVAVTLATLAAGSIERPALVALEQPWWLLAVLVVVDALLLPRLWRATAPGGDVGRAASLAALLIAVTYVGPITNAKAFDVVDVPAEVAAVRSKLPADAHLYSFGMTHHRFVYWYGDPIDVVPVPKTADDLPTAVEYFVVTTRHGKPAPLPFAWEPVGTVNLDRKRSADPVDGVMVGRRTR